MTDDILVTVYDEAHHSSIHSLAMILNNLKIALKTKWSHSNLGLLVSPVINVCCKVLMKINITLVWLNLQNMGQKSRFINWCLQFIILVVLFPMDFMYCFTSGFMKGILVYIFWKSFLHAFPKSSVKIGRMMLNFGVKVVYLAIV